MAPCIWPPYFHHFYFKKYSIAAQRACRKPCLGYHGALQAYASHAVFLGRFSRDVLFGESEDIRRKIMKSSGFPDRPAQTGTNTLVSESAGSGKAAVRERLGEALRANLGRRKAQKKDRAKQTGAAVAQVEAAQGEAAQSQFEESGASPEADTFQDTD
jgi:hypothetical protein